MKLTFSTPLIRLKTLIPLLFIFVVAQTSIADDQNITFGGLVSLSGNWALIGQNIQEGSLLAIEEANQSGGLLGKKISISFQDTDEEKSGGKVVTAYRFLRGQGVKFFIGPTGAPGLLALIPIAKNEETLVIGPTATGSYYKAAKNFFNAGGDNFFTTKTAAERMYQDGYRNVAIFGSLQPWENDQAKTFKAEFEKLGGKIVEEVFPLADQADLNTEALKIVNAKPEAIFFAIFNQVAVAAKALAKLHYTGPRFASIMDEDHVKASLGTLKGTNVYLFNPPGSMFIEKFKKRYGKEPGIFADSAYDAVKSLIVAIQKSQSLEFSNVIGAMHSEKFKGSNGSSVGYDNSGYLERGISLYEITDQGMQKQ